MTTAHRLGSLPSDGRTQRGQAPAPRSIRGNTREPRRRTPPSAMNAQQLLQEISNYCRQTGLAESTFGRRAVNDGKLAARLRNGGRITTDTLDRIRAFMHSGRSVPARTADRAHHSGAGCGDVDSVSPHMKRVLDRGPGAVLDLESRIPRSERELPCMS